jgi:hypothetical protein
MKNMSRHVRYLVSLMALIILASPGARSLCAQQAAKAVMDPRKVKELWRDKRQALTAIGAPTKAHRDAIGKYYVFHVFRGMTQPEALDDPMRYPNWRKEMVSDLERLQSNPTLYRYLRDDLCFRYLKPLVAGKDYSPACRYNATLMIGMLNDQEGDRNSSTPFPVPYEQGRKFLIQVVRAKSVPESVRIAALIGLRRHAELLAARGTPDASMGRPLVDVIRANVPDAENADAAYWQKRLAIEALGAMGPGAAVSVLSPIVNDPNMPLTVRCAAAKALGQLDYRSVPDVDASAILKGLGAVAVSACRNEITRVQKHNQENPEPARGNQPLFGGPQEAPQADPLVTRVRRQLKHRLNWITMGIDGVEKIAAQPDQKTLVANLRTEINEIQTGLDDGVETMSPNELLNKIGPPAIRLEGLSKAGS